MITHKFREVLAYANHTSVLRQGRLVGGGETRDLTTKSMSQMMVGTSILPEPAKRAGNVVSDVTFKISGASVINDGGLMAVEDINLEIKGGGIVGVAGVSGNRQSELVEAITGQRKPDAGTVFINGRKFDARRKDYDQFGVLGLPEEPLNNAAVSRMTVAENIAFRAFDKKPFTKFGFWLSPQTISQGAGARIAQYNVKTSSADTPIENLSGGSIQRTILARELSGNVKVLIVANLCFGLDFASVSDIRAKIIDQRNRGAAVVLISGDLDEILELSDRIAVMSEGRIDYVANAGETDRTEIGRQMAGT